MKIDTNVGIANCQLIVVSSPNLMLNAIQVAIIQMTASKKMATEILYNLLYLI